MGEQRSVCVLRNAVKGWKSNGPLKMGIKLVVLDRKGVLNSKGGLFLSFVSARWSCDFWVVGKCSRYGNTL